MTAMVMHAAYVLFCYAAFVCKHSLILLSYYYMVTHAFDVQVVLKKPIW